MDISNIDDIFNVIVFIIPGFLSYGVQSAFVPQKAEPIQITVLRLVTFGSVNYALWSWLIYLMNTSAFFQQHPGRLIIAWFFILLISPLLIGLVAGNVRQTGSLRRRLQMLGLNPMHYIPTAWDYKFPCINTREWVKVSLKDGSTICGLFASGSFCSSDPHERDLYIEEAYKERENEQWSPVPLSRGVLIRPDEIRYIEFFNADPEKANG